MKRVYILMILLIPFAAGYAQQNIDFIQRAAIIHNNIYKFFYDSVSGLYYENNHVQLNEKKHSYLWPLCALLQAANEGENIEQTKDFMLPVMNAIAQYYSNISPAPAYQVYVLKEEKDDRFYDDNQWIAIACLDAYNRTKKQLYLTIAQKIYTFMLTGYDTVCGGGLYWKEGDKTTKNTCSNGPAILVALQLYKITGNKNYLDTALLIYNWVNLHLQSPQGVYFDNIKIPSLKIDSALYTYNTGTMLQANALLYQITNNKKYLNEAQHIADIARTEFYKNSRLPSNHWFNVVLLRGFIELYNIEHDKNRLQFFIDDANRIWKDEKDSQGLLGIKTRKSLIDQAAMMEMYARLAKL